MRAFTHYWTSDTWEGYRGEEVTYTAANIFRKRGLKKGDRIYIVSNLAGRVRLGAAIDVGEVVGRAEARRRFRREVWDGSDFAIARKPIPFDPDLELPISMARRLRFLPDGEALKFSGGKLDQQTLRGLRELTPQSAALLEAAIRKKTAGDERDSSRQEETPDEIQSLRDRIVDPNTRAAFERLVEYGKKSTVYSAGPGGHGYIKDFRYEAKRKWPFAFTCNQGHLLFYLREAGVRALGATEKMLSTWFDEVKALREGVELTVRIRTVDDASRVIEHVLDPWAKTASTAGNADRVDRSSQQEVAERYPWRYDAKLASARLSQILSDASSADRQWVERLLAQDLAFADSLDPERHILNLHDHYVRLTCGRVMCLQIAEGGQASVLVQKKGCPRELLAGHGTYENAPGCAELHLTRDQLLRNWPVLEGLHQSAIRICIAKAGVIGSHRRAHSPGLVAYLRPEAALPGVSDARPKKDQEFLAEVLDLPETEREALRKYRCAQGLFRVRVAALEKHCRVTGISDPSLLRASHIKPWRLSTDTERQDGNNGLFLAPHVDALFDGGRISFSDDGDLLVSKRLDPAVLESWGITFPLIVGRFRPEQCEFLEWHRAEFGFSE